MSALMIHAQVQRKDFELDVDVSLPLQGVTAILGPSGSGKSTLLRLLAGLECPTQGEISFNGQVWSDTKRRIFMPPQQRRIGMVFQDYALFQHMTVAENIGYGLARAERTQQVGLAIERFHLHSLAQRYPAQLSGGQRQRVALARALITKPSLLLLDEPFSAVDAALRQNLRRELKNSMAAAECPSLLITHYLEDVYYLADYIGVMINGRMLQFGLKHDVLSHPNCKATAELLGWQNFLPIRGITHDRVYGGWGEYSLAKEVDISSAWLSIRAEHIQLLPALASTIKAEVLEQYELGQTRVIICRLEDGTAIQRQQPLLDNYPRQGEMCSIGLPDTAVAILPDRVSGNLRHVATPAQDSMRISNTSKIINIKDKLTRTR